MKYSWQQQAKMYLSTGKLSMTLNFRQCGGLDQQLRLTDDDEGVFLSVFFHSSDYQQEMMERINDLFRQMCAECCGL